MSSQPSIKEASARPSGGNLAAVRYQGAHSRRGTRYVMAICLGALFVDPVVLADISLGHRLTNIAVAVAVIAFCDIWFARRMGVTITRHGLTLHYAFYRKSVSWSHIEGFEWRKWRSPTTETLWITTGRAPIRVPTIGRSTGSYLGSRFDSFFGSSKLRSFHREDVDAMATLNDALKRAANARRNG